MLARNRRCFIHARNDYTELRRRLNQRDVFQPQLAFYGLQALVALALVSLCIGLLVLTQDLRLRLLVSGLLAFAFIQLGFVFHDAGHRQIFGRPRLNDIAMMLVGFVIGSSRSWWFDSHNRHHSNPNDLDLDPDTELYVVNFSEEQSRNRKGFLGRLTRFQAIYFFPLLSVEGIGAHAASIVFLIRQKARYRRIETIGMVLHFVVYFGVILALMPVWHALLFMLVHHLVAGLYMGSVFAPNHKGMLVPDPADRIDLFHRQVLTSRNIAPNPLVDIWYGGLNYQIEHHLFPMIPRNKLKTARLVVKDYCFERGISYHETNMWQSYKEIVSHLHAVASPLREKQARRDPFSVPDRQREEVKVGGD